VHYLLCSQAHAVPSQLTLTLHTAAGSVGVQAYAADDGLACHNLVMLLAYCYSAGIVAADCMYRWAVAAAACNRTDLDGVQVIASCAPAMQSWTRETRSDLLVLRAGCSVSKPSSVYTCSMYVQAS
jgi:hypothetical protein